MLMKKPEGYSEKPKKKSFAYFLGMSFAVVLVAVLCAAVLGALIQLAVWSWSGILW